MKFLNKCCTIAISVLFYINCLGQNNYKVEFDQLLLSDHSYSYKKILAMAKSKNAYDFMAIGYFLDANNIMFKKTKEKKYLNYNMEVIKLMFLNDPTNAKEKWLMKVDKSNQNSVINGKESIVSEGYFYRYLGSFLDLLQKERIYVIHQKAIKVQLKKGFDKWSIRSNNKYNDQSLLYHQRVHIAANWVMVSLYLYKFTGQKNYFQFYDNFDGQLREMIKIKKINRKNCYVWNSTYANPFSVELKKQKVYKQEIQDITHGNHVVAYVIKAHELYPKRWTKNDLQCFSNTINYIVWNNKTVSFSDNVDGSFNKALPNTGWKQSDGWMKLIPYDTKLKNIYEKFYQKKGKDIKKSSLGLQFIANLY